jgi:hypothetical protein
MIFNNQDQANQLNPYSYGTVVDGELTWDKDSYNRYMQAVIRAQGQQAALTAVSKWAYKEPQVGERKPFFGPKRPPFPMQPSKTPAPQQIDPRLNPYQARLRAGPRGPSFRSPWIGGF